MPGVALEGHRVGLFPAVSNAKESTVGWWVCHCIQSRVVIRFWVTGEGKEAVRRAGDEGGLMRRWRRAARAGGRVTGC